MSDTEKQKRLILQSVSAYLHIIVCLLKDFKGENFRADVKQRRRGQTSIGRLLAQLINSS